MEVDNSQSSYSNCNLVLSNNIISGEVLKILTYSGFVSCVVDTCQFSVTYVISLAVWVLKNTSVTNCNAQFYCIVAFCGHQRTKQSFPFSSSLCSVSK